MFYQLALLEHGWHDVSAVANGAEALEVGHARDRARSSPTSAMPSMPGDVLIAELRAKPEFRDLPVLVVTEHPSGPEVRAPRGPTVLLRKPFELDDFIRWVDAAEG